MKKVYAFWHQLYGSKEYRSIWFLYYTLEQCEEEFMNRVQDKKYLLNDFGWDIYEYDETICKPKIVNSNNYHPHTDTCKVIEFEAISGWSKIDE